MAKRLFVGNLSYNTSSQELEQLFSEFGTVASISLITDRETGRSKGFAFVEMSSDEEFEKALSLNGREVDGRALVVNEARPREDRPRNDDRFGRNDRFGGRSDRRPFRNDRRR